MERTESLKEVMDEMEKKIEDKRVIVRDARKKYNNDKQNAKRIFKSTIRELRFKYHHESATHIYELRKLRTALKYLRREGKKYVRKENTQQPTQ